MRGWALGLTLVLMTLGLPAGAPGQVAADPVLDRTSRSLQIGIADRPQIGYWLRIGERTDLGIVGSLAYHSQPRTLSYSIGPAWKRYGDVVGGIAPYTYLGLGLAGLSQRAQEDVSTSQLRAEAQAGVGMEWFPHPRISVGGHAGVRGGPQWIDVDLPGHDRRTRWTASTFTSGIRLHLYL
jgi:hypothetical protein